MSVTAVVIVAPALFTSMSRLRILLAQLAMEGSEEMFRARVSMLRDDRCDILERF